MGTVDVKNGQRFERRIGRRIEVDPIDVTFFVPQSGRFRKKAPPHEVPGRIENVSITGAAIIGPSSLPWQPGDRVVVRSRGADNVVVVRHRQATGAGHRFGVELTRSAVTLKRQIQVLLEPHLTARVVDEVPSGPVLGLKRAESPRLGGLPLLHPPTPEPSGEPAPEPAAAILPDVPPPPPPAPAPVDEVVPAPPPAPAPVDLPAPPPAPISEPGPVLDLSGPEPVLDLTDSVMGAPVPEPVLAAEPESPPEPEPEPVLADALQPEPIQAPAVESEAVESEAVESEAVESEAVEPEAVEPDALEPAPVLADVVEAEALAIEPEDEAPTTDADERVVAPRAPSPHLPHSPGRQVLDEVFGLMQD